MDELQDDEDPARAELSRLKGFARGRAGAELGDKLGLPAPGAGDDEAAEGEPLPAPADGGGLDAALASAGVTPEQLAQVIEALKAAG